MKRAVWDIQRMTDQELRDLISRANAQERRLQAPYKKGRRGWRALRADAEAELARRGSA